MNMRHVIVVLAGVLGLAQAAHAQVPFFQRGGSAFTPEISIVSTGVLSDVQATVSADEKYVTLNMRPQNSTLLSLRSFNFQQGTANFGNVGDPPPTPPAKGGAAGKNAGKDDPSSAVRTSPSEILARAKAQASVLHQSGMTKVSGLKD